MYAMNSETTFCVCFFFFFKQKTAYEMRISYWSSDVCSSDLQREHVHRFVAASQLVVAGVNHLPRIEQLRSAADRGGQADHVRIRLEAVSEHVGDAEIRRASCRERVCQYA